MFWYLVGLIDLGISVRIFFFVYLFLFWILGLKWFRAVMRLILQSTYYAINHINAVERCFSLYNNLSLNMYLFFYTFLMWVILFFVLFEYRTSSKCFFTYILFEFSSTIYTQGHNIFFFPSSNTIFASSFCNSQFIVFPRLLFLFKMLLLWLHS